ncbi:DHA2 family efflux MFS transporter permease subunit [Labrys sp. ZIDIC5]|nr:DHA2 family efflux MFS transporter permease subunit [Labrys sp. ZIDIC5]MDZ5454427.1 DHA2 family efflux MFS transporter permease subunit [Labrys sp. ZIDIC5]
MQAGGISSRHACLLLCALCAAAAVDSMNSTVLVIARAQVMGSVHATPDEIAWVHMGYVAAKLTAFPVAAWMAMRMSAAVLIAAATLGLLVSALGCFWAHGLLELVVWRIVQGIAGALILVVGQAVLFSVFARARQGLVQAVFAFATIMVPTTLAPALQGWVVDQFEWQWMFLASLPLGVVGGSAVFLAPRRYRSTITNGPFDWLGLILFGSGMTTMVFLTQEGSRHNWFDEVEIVQCAVLALIAFTSFGLWQCLPVNRRRLVDWKVFRDQHFSFGFAVSFVAGCALFGSAFVIPAFAMGVLDFSPTYAGVLLLPSGLFVCIGLLAAGAIIQFKNLDPSKPIPLGIACFMAAMWLLSGSTSQSGLADLVPSLLLRGFGLGLLFVSLTLVTLRDLPDRSLADGIALFNFGRQFGGQIGVAWLSTYLDRQNALNLTVLAPNLAPGNGALAERQEQLAAVLAARGYGMEEDTVALTSIIQKAVVQQVATLSFNECFLAVALLFVAAAPVLIATKLLLARTMPHEASSQQVEVSLPPATAE